jgi:gas vesicle protein
MTEDYGRFDERGHFASSAFLMLLAGAAVGAAAALMFAPASGRETRAYLGRRGKSFADDVAERGKKMWAEHGEHLTAAVRRGYDQATSGFTHDDSAGPHPVS